MEIFLLGLTLGLAVGFMVSVYNENKKTTGGIRYEYTYGVTIRG